jgi:nucleotide-binding universal stress UspA family protein
MDTFLIATDFSHAAQNAFFYGYELARGSGAKIVLFHAYQTVSATADMLSIVTEEEIRLGVEERLLSAVRSLPCHPSTIIRTLAVKGRPFEAICEAARELDAKYIIVGMKGNGQTVRRLFGSTAISLGGQSLVPVIVVPEEAWYTWPKVIALASDIDELTSEHVLDPLKELGYTFHSKLVVVRIIESGTNESIQQLLRPHRLKGYLKELKPTFEFITDDDVVNGLNQFVADKNVDMVVMVGQEHNFLERLFIRSDVNEMLFQSEVPVLVLPHKVLQNELEHAGSYAAEIT